MTAFAPSASPAQEAPTPAEIEALRRHPRFGEACSIVIAGLAEHFRGDRALNRLLSDRGRFFIGLMILDMHYNGAGEGGLTATRLKRRCVEEGICSPGRVTALLGAMRLLGYIESMPSADRRTRRLRPTRKLLDTHRHRWACFIEALALLMPEGEIALERGDDDTFVADRLAVFAHMFASGMRLTDYVPEFGAVARRDAGVPILFALTTAARAEGRDPFAPLDLTISALAEQFTVSRGHVLSVLRDCEAEGMAVRSGERGRIAVTPGLLDAVDRFAAAGLLIHAASVRGALAMPARRDAISARRPG